MKYCERQEIIYYVIQEREKRRAKSRPLIGSVVDRPSLAKPPNSRFATSSDLLTREKHLQSQHQLIRTQCSPQQEAELPLSPSQYPARPREFLREPRIPSPPLAGPTMPLSQPTTRHPRSLSPTSLPPMPCLSTQRAPSTRNSSRSLSRENRTVSCRLPIVRRPGLRARSPERRL